MAMCADISSSALLCRHLLHQKVPHIQLLVQEVYIRGSSADLKKSFGEQDGIATKWNDILVYLIVTHQVPISLLEMVAAWSSVRKCWDMVVVIRPRLAILVKTRKCKKHQDNGI